MRLSKNFALSELVHSDTAGAATALARYDEIRTMYPWPETAE